MNLEKINNRDKKLASLSYLWVFSVLIFAIKTKSVFVEKHSKIGLLLFISSIIFWLIPILHFFELLIMLLSIHGFIISINGTENRIPILYEFSNNNLNYLNIYKYLDNLKLFFKKNFNHNIKNEILMEEKNKEKEEKFIHEEESITEKDEKKLSAIFKRINKQDKRISDLENKFKILTNKK